MSKFYFTYGTSASMPFQGGWTEIEVEVPGIDSEAKALNIACSVFKNVHPNGSSALLNCSSVYSEHMFKQTEMYQKGSNLGKGCVESIKIHLEEFV